MELVFIIEKESIGFVEVESKTPGNIWSVTGLASTKIEVGDELISNLAHYGDSSKKFIVKEVFAREDSKTPFLVRWNRRLLLQGPEGVNLEDWSAFYPKIPGIERLSDGFWKVYGNATTEVKLGDLVFFGAVVQKNGEGVVDSLKPDVILVVEDILVDGEHASTIDLGQKGFLILRGGDVLNTEDAYLLCS